MGDGRGRGRPFPKGTSGNARGRPKGSKNTMPLVRELVNEVRAEHDAAAREAYRRALTNPRTVLDALRLEAQLNRELGAGPKIELNQGEPVRVTLTWLVVTANAAPDLTREAIALGAVHVISKPFDLALLERVLDSAMQDRQRRLAE